LERGWEEVGVERRRPVWDMNEKMLVGVGDAVGIGMAMGRERVRACLLDLRCWSNKQMRASRWTGPY
jgi:hypothetical protein